MERFFARLRGENEVPPVSTDATGRAFFRVVSRNHRLRLSFLVILRNIRRVREIHLHLGKRGENGPIVAFLFRRSRRSGSNRLVVFGSITRQDLVGPLRGHSIQDLIREINSGNVYINVHTRRHPDGEIRGQLRRVGRRNHQS